MSVARIATVAYLVVAFAVAPSLTAQTITAGSQSKARARDLGIPFDGSGLPPGLSRLIDLAETVPENKEADSAGAPQPFVERVGAADSPSSR